MGIFGKLFGALKKTKDNFSGKLRMLFSKNKLGDEFYEELEEILISSDVSVAAAEDQEMLVGDIGQPARSPPVRHINDIIGMGAEKFRFVVSIHFCTSRTSSLISTPSAGGTSMN